MESLNLAAIHAAVRAVLPWTLACSLPAPAASSRQRPATAAQIQVYTGKADIHGKGRVHGLILVNPDAPPIVNVEIAVRDALVSNLALNSEE